MVKKLSDTKSLLASGTSSTR